MSLELDYFEYANDGAVQAAFITSEATANVADQSSLTGSDDTPIYGDGGATHEKHAQEFQVSENLTCYSIKIKLSKTLLPTDNVVVRIETDNAGLPSGNLVNANATQVKDAATLTGVGTVYEFVFPATFSLSSGTVYHLVVGRSGARDTDNYAQVFMNSADVYASGTRERLDAGSWGNLVGDLIFEVYKVITSLQCYSEAAIKTQGSFALKGAAYITTSLNETLTRTIGVPINLSGYGTIKFDIRSTRTGANIKIGIHDSGGTTSEKTYTILAANTYEIVTWDISGVTNANKDAIDQIIVTIIEATAANTFYLDNMYAELAAGGAIFFGANM